MVTANTQFPQRDPDATVFSQFDGLRNDIAPERFELGDLQVAENVNIDKSGRLSRRDGYTNRVVADAHSIWADETQSICMYVAAATLRRLSMDFSSVPLVALQDALAPMAYMRVSDRVYFTNGRDKGIFEAGAVRTWGLPVAPLPGAAAAVGNMPAGRYQFAMTWLRADGQESGCGLAGQIDLPAGGAIAFTLPPVPQADVVARVIYISAPNAEVLYEAATVAAAESSLTWGSDPTTLATPLATQFFGPPPAGQLVAHYRGHTFVAVDDTIYVSDRYGYELFNLRRYLQLDGRITLLAAHTEKESTDTGRGSGFFVGTDRSMGIIAGSDPDSFQYVPKVDYGAVPGTMRFIDASLVRDGGSGARKLPLWLSVKGICIGLPDLLINNLTRTRYEMTAGGQGAAVVLPDPHRLIVTSNI